MVPSAIAVTVKRYVVFGSSPVTSVPLAKFVCGDPTSVVPLLRYTRTVYETAWAVGLNTTFSVEREGSLTVGADGRVRCPSVTTRSTVADCVGSVSPSLMTVTLTLPPPTFAAVSMSVASATLTRSCGPEN